MIPRFKTMLELRQNLAVSLGFGAMQGMIDLQVPILNQFLIQAQNQLWRDVKWRYLLKRHRERLGYHQRVLDLPDEAPLGVLHSIHVEYSNGNWRELRAGIPRSGFTEDEGKPLWYELTAGFAGVPQIEFAPIPSEPIDVVVEYYAAPARFENDFDRASVPDDILLSLAIVMAKGHYRQADVQLYTDRFSNMLRQAKAANFGVDGGNNEYCSAIKDSEIAYSSHTINHVGSTPSSGADDADLYNAYLKRRKK